MSENSEKNRKLGKAFLGAALLFFILILATAAAGAISYRAGEAATASDAESVGHNGQGQTDAESVGHSGQGQTGAEKTSEEQTEETVQQTKTTLSQDSEEKEVVLTCQGAKVKIVLESVWDEGEDAKETGCNYSFSIQNTGDKTVSDWKIILKTEVTPVSVECWDADCEWKNGTLTLEAKGYNGIMKAGETCEGVGMNVRLKQGETPVFRDLQVEYQ